MEKIEKCDKCKNNFFRKFVSPQNKWSQINEVSFWTEDKKKTWKGYHLLCRSCLKDWFEKEKNLFDKLVEPKKKKLFLGYRSNGVFNKQDLVANYQPFEAPAAKPLNKACLECSKTLNFLAVKKNRYLCGKTKCLRGYVERNKIN